MWREANRSTFDKVSVSNDKPASVDRIDLDDPGRHRRVGLEHHLRIWASQPALGLRRTKSEYRDRLRLWAENALPRCACGWPARPVRCAERPCPLLTIQANSFVPAAKPRESQDNIGCIWLFRPTAAGIASSWSRT